MFECIGNYFFFGALITLRTIYILHNPFYAIYIFPTLYSWIFPIKLMNAQEIVSFLGVIS